MRIVKVACGPDVRRVALEDNVTFESLASAIKEMDLQVTGNFIIQYKDEEEELITITNDREWQEALAVAQGGILRLILAPRPGLSSSGKWKEVLLKLLLQPVADAPKRQAVEDVLPTSVPPASAQIDQPAVVCVPLDSLPEEEEAEQTEEPEESEKQDEFFTEEPRESVYHLAYCNNCKNDIYNIRYKCGNCDDFDLCEECEANWSHDLSIHDVNHVFLKIYRPISTKHTQTLLPELYEIDNTEEEEDESETEGSSSDSESDEDDSSSESSSDSDDDDDDEESESDNGEEMDEAENATANAIAQIEKALSELDIEFASEETPDEAPEQVDVQAMQSSTDNSEAETPTQTEEGQHSSPILGLLRSFQRLIRGQPEDWTATLESLEEMGFTDRERNRIMLEKKGDISDVLDELLGEL